jgi:cytochrome c peroxidase
MLLIGLFVMGSSSQAQAQGGEPNPDDLAFLGESIFYDANLSANGTQSCATCHAPEVGFSGPVSEINDGGAVYPGAIEDRFGNRKPPVSAYAGDSPNLHYDAAEGEWVGGMFWDGRATGEILGDPLAEQAQGPFLNPLEQAMADAGAVCVGVANSAYAQLFEEVWGAGSLNCVDDIDGSYERIARSIAAFERSPASSAYTSKFDLFWDNAQAAGKDVSKIKFGTNRDPYRWQLYRGLGLSDTELQGLAVFNDPNRANCASCHSLAPGPAGYPLLTDFSYHNLGIPKNLENPFYSMPPEWNPEGENWVDYGLGGYLMSAGYAPEVYESELGKFKVPTLRNVDLRPGQNFVKAYGHNGYFKSLSEIIHFYQCRGMMGGGCKGGGCGCMGCNYFPGPEVNQNLTQMKHFSGMDRNYIAYFLKTLSDGFYQK